MDKKSFLTELEKTLKMQNVADIDSIVEEYDEHFKFKIADSYSEEEVAARLGSPIELARQYSPADQPQRAAGKAVIVAGLIFAQSDHQQIGIRCAQHNQTSAERQENIHSRYSQPNIVDNWKADTALRSISSLAQSMENCSKQMDHMI